MESHITTTFFFPKVTILVIKLTDNFLSVHSLRLSQPFGGAIVELLQLRNDFFIQIVAFLVRNLYVTK